MKYRSSVSQVSVGLVKYRSYIGQVSVMYRSSISHVSVRYRSSIDGLRFYRSTHLSVDCRLIYRSTIDRQSVDCRPIGDSPLIVDRQSTDISAYVSADMSTEATYSTHDPNHLQPLHHLKNFNSKLSTATRKQSKTI